MMRWWRRWSSWWLVSSKSSSFRGFSKQPIETELDTTCLPDVIELSRERREVICFWTVIWRGLVVPFSPAEEWRPDVR